MANRFDVIVVGAGPAGSSAAYTLANMGFKVLLLERGRVPGSKNMFGGKVHIAPLKDIYKDFEKSAPIHRWVVNEKVSLIYRDDMVSVEYRGGELKAFTTFLTQLSGWMANKAEESGATLLTEITVDGFYTENNVVKGVMVMDEVVKADIVIDAEGINRLLLERGGYTQKLSPDNVALGVKEVIKLSTEDINDYFNLNYNEGLAWILIGEVSGGIPGGAFIYTQEDAVSLGVVIHLNYAEKMIKDHVYKLVEGLRIHPLLKNYFERGTLIEYSAHLIPENFDRVRPASYCYDGLLISGDAAGFLLNLGYTYRGVDYAAYSGYLAAKAYEKAHGEGKYDKETLSYYEKLLYQSFIMRNLNKFKGVHGLMKNPRIFSLYPELITTFIYNVFSMEYDSKRLIEAFKEAKKGRVGWLTFIKDLISVVRSI